MIEINISSKAREKLADLLAQEPGRYPRLVFQGLGWKGSELKLTLDELEDDDGKISVEGLEVIFKKKEKLYVHKSVVDYDISYPDNGFKVTPFFQGF